MKKYVLNYYSAFRCAQGACKHTCCAGWEMPIDGKTLAAYKAEQSDFSAHLKKGINFKKARFKTDKAGRCAFLNEKGLCRIITALGEGALCQVCRDHPRFRSFFNDREELGLGFCCEEAARLILSFPQKIELLLADGREEENRGAGGDPNAHGVGGDPNAHGVGGDPNAHGAGGNPSAHGVGGNPNAQGEEGATMLRQGGESVPLDYNQQNVLNFREKAIRIVQNRTQPIENRVQSLLKLCLASPAQADEKAVLKRFLTLERLDGAWTRRLKMLKTQPLIAPVKEELSLCCEQFLVNSLYRYLSDAEDTAWVRARAVACVLAWWVVQAAALLEANDALSKVQNPLLQATDFPRTGKENAPCKNKAAYAETETSPHAGNAAHAPDEKDPLFAAVVEAARAFSCEVDYSQKNLDRLFAFAYQFVKI